MRGERGGEGLGLDGSSRERVGIGAHGDGLRELWGVEDTAGPLGPTDRVGGAESVFLVG